MCIVQLSLLITLGDYGGTLTAYSWQDLSPSSADKVADMTENWLSHLQSQMEGKELE